MRNDEPDALERWLDRALAQYSSAEPLAGIEQRVLNRVRADGAVRRFRFGRCVLAVGVALVAGLVVAAVWWIRPVPRGAGSGHVIRAVALPDMRLAQEQATPAGFGTRAGQAGRPVPLPKRHEFPAPAPVSREERAVLAFADLAPDVLREAFAGKQPRPAEPIRIEEIKIEPLQSDGAR